MIKLNGYQIVLTHPTVCVKVKTTPTRPKFGSLGMVSISIIYLPLLHRRHRVRL